MDVSRVSSSWLGYCSGQTLAAAQRASRVLLEPCSSLCPLPACGTASLSLLGPGLRRYGVEGNGPRCSGFKQGSASSQSETIAMDRKDGIKCRQRLVKSRGVHGKALIRTHILGCADPGISSPGPTVKLRAHQGEAVVVQGTGWERDILRAGEGANGAIATAFSTMVFMLRAIQNYAMHLRQHLSPYEKHDIQELMVIVQREMHSSLLWLFQTVFSATPVLMVSVMLLLANFSVHSAGSLAPAEASVLNLISTPPVAQQELRSVSDQTKSWNPVLMPLRAQAFTHQPLELESIFGSAKASKNEQLPESPPADSGGRGHSTSRKLGSMGEEGSPASAAWDLRSALVRVEEGSTFDQAAREASSSSSSPQDRQYLHGLLEQAAKEMELEVPYHHVRLDQEVIRQLVAPLGVEVDPDNYPCFDVTERQYLDALSKEPTNALLLGNMAMFMYVVRKDKERAQWYFQQALEADPEDGETLSRYASFLWLGLGNLKDAEVAYKAAIAADPANPYFTGSYAHFLWHAREDETSCPIGETC